MRRYWIEKKDIFQNQVNFSGDLFHHIFDVCRQGTGSKFEVLTEDSKAYFVEVIDVSKKTATARILEERQIAPLKEPRIHLALALSRFPVMDAIMEKAVELGVASIQPLFSEFSFIRKSDKLSSSKIERWEKIIRSATQQSGRGDLMKIHPVMPLDKFVEGLNQNEAVAGLFAYEGPSTLSIKEAVQNIKRAHGKALKDIWIIVGSEGGFSLREIEGLKELALDPVTLGSQVLRVETACLALVSVLKYDLDLMA